VLVVHSAGRSVLGESGSIVVRPAKQRATNLPDAAKKFQPNFSLSVVWKKPEM
jgi:hypothetical protein